jgi:AraC family ethanolamine operon transcriptional activator
VTSDTIVEVCERFVQRRGYCSVRMTDLCVVAGVSERRVRDAFYECHGTSPTAYLRARRLQEVRRALLAAPAERDAVTRAASDCGFGHLSRFAGQYRAMFGETPSATVSRARELVQTQT